MSIQSIKLFEFRRQKSIRRDNEIFLGDFQSLWPNISFRKGVLRVGCGIKIFIHPMGFSESHRWTILRLAGDILTAYCASVDGLWKFCRSYRWREAGVDEGVAGKAKAFAVVTLKCFSGEKVNFGTTAISWSGFPMIWQAKEEFLAKMYALETPPTSNVGHLSSASSQTSSSAAAAAAAHHAHLEQMASNLYNLDSATMSSYSHPSSHSPYNNSTAHSLLLPSSVNYHHLELNPGSVSNTPHPLDASSTDTHPRLSGASSTG